MRSFSSSTMAQKRFMLPIKSAPDHQHNAQLHSMTIEEEPEVELPQPVEDAEELHLGDTQELDLLDALDDIAELEEFEEEEDEDSKLAMQISSC